VSDGPPTPPSATLLDVTRALAPGHPNWPGDVALEFGIGARIADGDAVNVGSIRTSLHAGTHVDAPWHYDDRGARLGAVDLRRLVGEALVLDVSGGDGAVTVADLEAALVDAETAEGALPPRALLHTGEPDAWGTAFPTGFRPLAPAAVDWLAQRGVRLIGTDAPSVDPLTSKDLPAHRACAAHDLTIVEGLALARVAPGRYELICLPLSLPEADASPARALLRPLG
jgi:arylformamidase